MSQVLHGIAAGGGITIAPVFVLGAVSLSASQQKIANTDHEVSRLHDSFSLSQKELMQLDKQAAQRMGHRLQTISTQLAILSDNVFSQLAKQLIVEDHQNAEWALQEAGKQLLHLSTVAISSPFWANTVRDLTQRVLSHLLNQPLPDITQIDHRAIIVANSISPTQVVEMNRKLVAGLVTETGGATSHFSLLSEELALPVVVGVPELLKNVHDDMVMIVDGIHGTVILAPSPKEIDRYQELAKQYETAQRAVGNLVNHQTISKDGNHYTIGANLSLMNELPDLKNSGAEGIGIFRTEFLFMDRSELPTEEEQYQAYRKVVHAMHGQRVIIRTLDIGNDKLLTSLKLPDEVNPALGMRGIRISLAHPELLRPQIRAILRASTAGQVAIMFPMISEVEEFQRASQLVDEEAQQLQREGVDIADNIEVGMMVETPAAVMMADQLAKYADFFSIGSNDLIQYLFAADRNNEKVAYLYQALHPVMLRTVRRVINCGHAEGKWVSMCGEMAALPAAQPLLMAMGLDGFSVPAKRVLPLRKLVHGLSARKMQPLVHQALDAANADEVRKLVQAQLPQLYED